MRSAMLVLTAVLVLVPAGCSKLADNKTRELKANEIWGEMIIPPFKNGLKFEIKVESDARLLGCVYTSANENKATVTLFQKKKPADALAFEEGKENFVLSGTIPENQEAKIYLHNIDTKTANVKVNILGR